MHELTVANSLIELAADHAARYGARRVTRIRVRLGVLVGLMRALHFCFAPACRGTLCENAVLDIDEVPLTVHCPACDAVKAPRARYNFRCPDCGTPTPRVVTGREIRRRGLRGTDVELWIPRAPTPTAAQHPGADAGHQNQDVGFAGQ